RGDWSGALSILDNNLSSGLIDKATYRRQRGVLLTARALELEKVDRDLSRESAMEAVKLAPTLVPAAVLAAKFESEAHQVRRAMRALRALDDPAWTADGYVSDRWRPVSPVTGKLDAFQWQTPVASLPSDKGAAIESSPFEDAMLAAPPPKRIEAESKGLAEPPR